jgi:hypothetical protein
MHVWRSMQTSLKEEIVLHKTTIREALLAISKDGRRYP